MPCTLRYGIASELVLPVEAEQLAGCFLRDAGTPLDARTATLAALAAPVEYPQLSQAVVPGDHVAIVVDRIVPRGVETAAAAVEFLHKTGIGLESMRIIFANAAEAEAAKLRTKQTTPMSAESPTKIEVEVHDPTDRGKLCFLSNTPSGRSIYVNRAIGEADFVVLIGSPRGTPSWSYRGPYGIVYPTFSDTEAFNRFRNPNLLNPCSDTFLKSQEEVESIGLRAGARFLIDVVPGAGDEASQVIAGELPAVSRRGQVSRDSGHRHEVPRRVRTVIAALTGRAAQTWEQFALVLGAALGVVEDGGVVAICSDLAEPLGPALDLLSKVGDDRDEAIAHIRKERPIDLFVALQLAEAQHRVRIHSLSKLEDETVESLAMTPIGDPSDLGRLAARGGSCIVVGDAQHAILLGPDSAK